MFGAQSHSETDLWRVLLIEDNPADAALLKATLRESPVPHEVTVISRGDDAIAYLKREHPYESAKMPHFVLLDLNLPRKSGFEVLGEIKGDPKLKIIPVIVLTSSESPEDVLNSYALGANSYLRKPDSLNNIRDLVHALEHFWLRFAVLPTRFSGAQESQVARCSMPIRTVRSGE